MDRIVSTEGGNALVFGILVLIVAYIITEWKDYNNQKIEAVDVSKGLKKEVGADGNQPVGSAESGSKKVLSPVAFKSFEIIDIIPASKDARLIRFKIPDVDENGEPMSIGLPIGRHITLQADIDGTRVMRPYTPCSSPNQRGYFELLIKAYEFGKMSSHVTSLEPGAFVNVRGPIGRFHYFPNKYRSIGLVAGGTGITPCLQVMRHILESDPSDRTSFVLFYQNRTFEDILLREELEELLAAHPDRLKIRYFLSNPACPVPRGKAGRNVVKGYVTREMLVELMRCPQLCQLTCVCGPSGFNAMVRGLLVGELGGVEGETVHVW
jgi:cytochrome-b5 reductase